MFVLSTCSSSKAIEVLEAYEGTLEDDYPPDNERYEHSEMLLYKVHITLLSHFGDRIAVTMLSLISIGLQMACTFMNTGDYYQDLGQICRDYSVCHSLAVVIFVCNCRFSTTLSANYLEMAYSPIYMLVEYWLLSISSLNLLKQNLSVFFCSMY